MNRQLLRKEAGKDGSSANQQSSVTFRGVSHSYRTRRGYVEALRDVSGTAEGGKVTCIVGPSGCGKSTLLDLVAGLQRPTSGAVAIDGAPVEGLNGSVAMVFQQPALFPWMTVLRNLTIGLNAKGIRGRDAEGMAVAALEMVGLAKVAASHPHELSGGMAQRVGIARALALAPDILLMDEPFAAVDAQMRIRLQGELCKLLEERPSSVLFVTHDIMEAVYLGDRIVVLSGQPGTVLEQVEMEADHRDRRSRYFAEVSDRILNMLV